MPVFVDKRYAAAKHKIATAGYRHLQDQFAAAYGTQQGAELLGSLIAPPQQDRSRPAEPDLTIGKDRIV